jgi:hypothetical protein
MQISILILISDEDLDSESSTKNNPAMQKRKRRLENSSDQDDDDLGARFAKLVKGSPNLGDFAEKLIELDPDQLNNYTEEERKEWVIETFPERSKVWQGNTAFILSKILASLFKQ